MKIFKALITLAIAAALLVVPAGVLAKSRDRDHDRMPDKWEKKHHLNVHAKDARKDQARMARAIVQAVANWNRPDLLKDISTGLPQAMRGISLETLSEDFVRTAEAKGLPRRTVVGKHALRAALTPLLTAAGLDIGGALGGTVITETTFGLRGLGRTAVDAVRESDLPTIIGIGRRPMLLVKVTV